MADLYSFVIYNVEQDLAEVNRFTVGPFVKSDLLETLATMDGMKVISKGTAYMKFPFMFCVELYVPECVSEDHVMKYVGALYVPKAPEVTTETLKETFKAMKDAVEKSQKKPKKPLEKDEYDKEWDRITREIFDDWAEQEKNIRPVRPSWPRWPESYPFRYPDGYVD